VINVSQVNAEEGLTINDNKSIKIITKLGRKIILQPIINNLSQFLKLELLQKLKLIISNNGVMQTGVDPETGIYYVARVSMMTEPTENEASLGFNSVKHPDLPISFKFVSLMTDNSKYSQAIYPTTNNTEELLAYDKNARFYHDGQIEITIDEKLYRGVFAYDITQTANTSDKISFEILGNSFIIHYTNGDLQTINLLK
jgi:hypothetical protein